ncbi:nudix hydrolase 23 [Luminiphilus syltensis NOR5-1B]|uniref:Nudix hydrolase 23 n=1 Tax=Luminiphilus syltensis NOR5-1B TaxID=565045 RepID=B8KRN9_9GAMM|nr:NUDIX hydrolase [Luminiphilus syltensis]EED35383.1 nudix hydrolase 23 [Luminiphilus syltensis NOR5-1B]
MKFCATCGGAIEQRVPEGDDRRRFVCGDCGEIHYINPRVIVGCLPEHNGKILLCRRAIEPRHGYWTLPAGFMENGETTAEGAARETLEEAAATACNLRLYRLLDVPHISQVYVFYRCGIEEGRFGIGPESLETRLFDEADIPWDEIAFPTVTEVLTEFLDDRKQNVFPVRHSVISLPDKFRKH